MDDQDAIVGPTNVQLDAVNAQGDRGLERRECVFALCCMESPVRKDVNHP
jgi:hypothetical protein